MRRLAIVSDTHWSRWEAQDLLAQALTQRLRQGGYHEIWHAGDVVDESVLVALEAFAPVVCVKGNCDRFFARDLPHAVRRPVEDLQLGMIHGWDLPLDHAPSVIQSFPVPTAIIIHGHTHRERCEEISTDHGPVVLLNPGSVSSPRGGGEPGFGELVINGSSWSYCRHSLL